MIVSIDSYVSYKDCVDYYLPYLIESGTSDLVEASGGIESDSPTNERIGSVLRSVKELHLPRYSYREHFQIEARFVEDGQIKNAPEGTTWIGVLYLGELGETCQGEPDKYGEDVVEPTWGSLVFYTVEHVYSAGSLASGDLPKLVVFWGDL